MPVLRLTAMGIADHHVRRIKLIDLLVTCRNITIILNRTLPIWRCLYILDLLGAAQWRLNFGHI